MRFTRRRASITPRARDARLLAAAASLALALSSCSRPDGGGAPPPDRPVIAEADGVRVEASATPLRVRVGDPVTLSIEVTAPPGTAVAMPAPSEGAFGPFTVEQQRRPPDVPLPDGRRRWSHAYVLATFDAGALEIPGLTVGYALDRDAPSAAPDAASPAAATAPPSRELTVGPIPVEVVSVLGEEAAPQLREISGFVDLPTSPPWWWWAAGIAVAVLIAALAGTLVMLRRGQRLGAAADYAPPVAPDAWARAALDALERENLPARGAVHEYFFRLSDIVRAYIERRFGLDATDRTTEEFIREMHAHPVLDAGHQRLLGSFLRSADLVKFARHEPPADECARAMAAARSFVEETAPDRTLAAADAAAAARDRSGTAA